MFSWRPFLKNCFSRIVIFSPKKRNVLLKARLVLEELFMCKRTLRALVKRGTWIFLFSLGKRRVKKAKKSLCKWDLQAARSEGENIYFSLTFKSGSEKLRNKKLEKDLFPKNYSFFCSHFPCDLSDLYSCTLTSWPLCIIFICSLCRKKAGKDCFAVISSLRKLFTNF